MCLSSFVLNQNLKHTYSCQNQVSRPAFEPCVQFLRIVVVVLRPRKRRFCRHATRTDDFLQGLVPTMQRDPGIISLLGRALDC